MSGFIAPPTGYDTDDEDTLTMVSSPPPEIELELNNLAYGDMVGSMIHTLSTVQ